MKTITLLSLLFLSCIGIAAAQRRASVGIVAGVNIANVQTTPGFAAYNPTATQSQHTGPVVGIGLHIPIGSLVFFRTGLQYIEKGVEVEFTNASIVYSFKYLSIPLHLGFAIGSGSTGGFVILGPNLGMNVSATGDLYDIHHDLDTTYDYDLAVQPIDVAIDLGVGIRQNIGERFYLTGEVRYSYGVFDVDRAAGKLGAENWWSRDITVAVSGFYRL